MDQNQRSGEEMEQNKMNDGDFVGEKQGTSEEICESQSSGEETVEYQSSCEETVIVYENQSSDDDEWVGGKRCPTSDPALPHYVSRRKGDKTNKKCCCCGKRDDTHGDKYHYYCAICQVEFHRHCRRHPSKIIHPYHPQHPLTFTIWEKGTGMVVATNFPECYEYHEYNTNLEAFRFNKSFEPLDSTLMFDKCTWCAKNLERWFYRCQICNFSLDFGCTLRNPPLTVLNPKNHHHSLSLFPQPASFPCHACGLIDVIDPGSEYGEKVPSYACYQCNYVVHQSCIGLPRIIKLTRHPHRLSHTPHLPPKVSSCRVCYKNVDIKYGQYSCDHQDCSFVVHSRCATHRAVWDGKELEWEPEEAEDIVGPYKKVGGGLIEHFSHHHYLKLEKYDGAKDSGKQCQACMCYILSSCEDFYNCIECEFFLHEVCANLPTKLDHGLHNHSLFLDPYPPLSYEDISCNVSFRDSSCWKYKCKKQECLEEKVQLDVNVILVPECFTHGSHPEHLLFMSTTYGYRNKALCQRCKKTIDSSGLQCTVCKFAMCYNCATIPDKVYCKYDEHPLSLCYGENRNVDGKYWCEVCEERLDPREWFYTNNECCTTIHVTCVFGESAFMKPGHTFDYKGCKVETISNNNCSRPLCRKPKRRWATYSSEHRCALSVYFKVYETDGNTFGLCSFRCLVCWF